MSLPSPAVRPPAIERIIDVLEATLGATAELRNETTDGPAIVLKSNRITFAVFFAEEFVEDYPAHQNDMDSKLLALPAMIKASPSRAVFVNAQGDIENLESDLIFQD
jgi:hypothetical protein